MAEDKEMAAPRQSEAAIPENTNELANSTAQDNSIRERSNGQGHADVFAEARSRIGSALIEAFFPGGEWKGGEYWPTSPIRADAEPGSFSISEQGLYHDFATSEPGGDFIELVSKARGISLKEAAEQILQFSGALPDRGISRTSRKKEKVSPLIPIPTQAANELSTLITSGWPAENYGKAVRGWRYYNSEGRWLFVVLRFERDGKKTIRPFYYGTDKRWHTGQPFENERPMYGLDSLTLAPLDCAVILTEGEKTCETVRRALGISGSLDVAMTWPGGAAAWRQADFKPLAGRIVKLWPDRDKPGIDAMEGIGAVLAGLDCIVQWIDPPEELGPGGDAADLDPATWPPARIHELIENAREWKSPIPSEPEPKKNADSPPSADEGHFEDLDNLFLFKNGFQLASVFDAADNQRKDSFCHDFGMNIEHAYMLGALLTFRDLHGPQDSPRLKLDGNTIFAYGEPRHCWEPLIDLTRPKDPFQPITYLDGNERVVQRLGNHYTYTTAEGKEKTRHFDRTATARNRDIFVQYCKQLVPPDPAFLERKPGKTISCADGLLTYRDGSFILEPHAPEHFQGLPSFPFKYIPWEKIPPERKDLVIRYFEQLFRNVPHEQLSSFVMLGGFLVGYTLTPFRAKRFFIFIGKNDGGKTSFLDIICSLHASTRTFAEADFQKMQKNPGDFDWVAFKHALAVRHDDFPPGGELPAHVLKKAVNPNTRITINEKFRSPFEQINTAAIYLSTNENPQSLDPYISNRLVAIPFDAGFTEEEQFSRENIDFMRKVTSPEMREAFFSFGIESLPQFYEEESVDRMLPARVEECTAVVTGSLNDVDLWLSEAIARHDLIENASSRADRRTLYLMYERSRKKPLGRNTFYMVLRKRFAETKSGEEQIRGLWILNPSAVGAPQPEQAQEGERP